MGKVIRTEFTVLDTLLRRVRDANPKMVVVVYEIDDGEQGTIIRVGWLGARNLEILGALSGAAQDVWRGAETVERGIRPGD